MLGIIIGLVLCLGAVHQQGIDKKKTERVEQVQPIFHKKSK